MMEIDIAIATRPLCSTLLLSATWETRHWGDQKPHDTASNCQLVYESATHHTSRTLPQGAGNCLFVLIISCPVMSVTQRTLENNEYSEIDGDFLLQILH